MWQKTEGQRWWQLFAYHYCLCGNDGYIYIHIYVLVFVAIFHFSGKQEQVNLPRTTADCHRLHGYQIFVSHPPTPSIFSREQYADRMDLFFERKGV